jgi:hypothetical protein
MISVGSMVEQKGFPLSVADSSSMSQVRSSEPPKGGAIIELNVLATALPSLTLASTDPSPNRLRIRSPPPNPNLTSHHHIYPGEAIRSFIELPSYLFLYPLPVGHHALGSRDRRCNTLIFENFKTCQY